MKHLMKTLIGTSAMMLVFGSCSSIPGAQEWKIKKTATAYIEQGLKGGERKYSAQTPLGNKR